MQLCASFDNKKIKLKHIPGPEGVRGRNSDNTLIKEVLGWAPSTPLAVGLRKTYEVRSPRWWLLQVFLFLVAMAIFGCRFRFAKRHIVFVSSLPNPQWIKTQIEAERAQGVDVSVYAQSKVVTQSTESLQNIGSFILKVEICLLCLLVAFGSYSYPDFFLSPFAEEG